MVNRIYRVTEVINSHLNNIHNEHMCEIAECTFNNLEEAMKEAKRNKWTIKVEYV